MGSRARLVERIWSHGRGFCRTVWERVRIKILTLARAMRNLAVTAGLPLRKEFLVLRCREPGNDYGLFSVFMFVLVALKHFETREGRYAGLQVDFESRGLYYDRSIGDSWWEYYFEPICIGRRENAIVREFGPRDCDLFAARGVDLARGVGYGLIERNIRVKPNVRDKVKAFVLDNFEGNFVLGIHYRGTDTEAGRLAYEAVAAAVRNSLEAIAPMQHKLFVASDEQAFVEYMRAIYPATLVCRDIFRSRDGQPIDVRNDDSNYTKGEDAIVDCLLLSRCDRLILTFSALSASSTLFNPDVPVIVLHPEKSR